jgi:hypothetical protein
VSNPNVIRRPFLATCIGAALILAPTAWLIPSAYWTRTRDWKPLDSAISLSKGRIQSLDFETNVGSVYSVRIARDYRVTCPQPCPELTGLAASWSVLKYGKIVARGEISPDPRAPSWDRDAGTFRADKGHYTVNFEVLEDASSANIMSPRLVIFEDGNKYFEAMAQRYRAFLVFLFCTPLGICLLVHRANTRRQEEHRTFLQRWSLTQTGPASPIPALVSPKAIAMPRPKLPAPRQRIPGLSSIALITVMTLEIVWIQLVVIYSGIHPPLRGLIIRVRRQVGTPG